MGGNPWEDYSAGIRWRPYQEQALASFAASRRSGEHRKFFLVAPPGAGKTLLGLTMAEQLEAPAVCFSPNAAVQQQWLDRLTQNWVCCDAAVEPYAPHPPCATEPNSGLALLSLTYQRIAVRDRSGRRHANVTDLHAALQGTGVKTVILDECHHLSAEWGEAIGELIGQLAGCTVIGLTATPLDQATGLALNLLGSPDCVISLPSVVRSGDLAPFQDLCHIVPPAAEAEALIAEQASSFERLFETLSKSEGQRFGLESWLAILEVEPTSTQGERLRDLSELYLAEPAFVAAWCRYCFSKEREAPAELPYEPEFYEAATLADRQLLAAHYLARQLCLKESGSPLLLAAKAALADWGWQVDAGRVQERPGAVARSLGSSHQKLAGMAEIVRSELRHMGGDLRVLVLTDFEFPPERSGGLSCVDVMDTLTSLADVDEVDPIMITGKSLLVDDDLWPLFQRCSRTLREQRGWRFAIEARPERGYCRIDGNGPDWNIRVQVAMVTQMLEDGISRCLIGTRALLGEGWDCVRLNTLIDLTAVTSPVMVNQIRGRTIRLSDEDPIKVANNWDVLCLSAFGGSTELSRLVEKHATYYGVSEDGLIQRGVGHLHGAFNRVSVEQLYFAHDEINLLMHQRAADRLAARDRWGVGSSYRDQEVETLAFAPPRSAVSRGHAQQQPPLRTSGLVVTPKAQAKHLATLSAVLGVGALGTLASCWAAWSAGLGFVSLAAAIPAASLYLARSLQKARTSTGDPETELQSLANILLVVLAPDQTDVVVETIKRSDHTLSVLWRGCSPDLATTLTHATAELLGPLVKTRYLITEEVVRLPERCGLRDLLDRGSTTRRVYVVPRVLARKRDAQHLLAVWQERRNGTAQLFHAASDQGKELLARHARQRPLEGTAAIRAVWH